MTKSVLFVDDDSDIRMIVRYALKGLSEVDLILVDSGVKGIKLMETTPFDLILLDVMMPGLDGVNTFHALKKIPLQKMAKVVFVTAKVQKEEVDAYLNLGAEDVILKPFDPLKLPDLIEKYLNK